MNYSRLSFRPALVIIGIALALLFTSCTRCPETSSQPYLILYAFDTEGELLSREMTVQDSLVLLGRMVYTGRLSDKDIVLAESGVGMTNAAMTAQFMIDRFHPVATIFTGIAGAIDSTVNIGDIVVCEKWRTHDYGYHGRDGFQVGGINVYDPASDSVTRLPEFVADESMFKIAQALANTDLSLGKIGDRLPKLTVGGVGVSGNCFIDNIEKRQWLSEQFQALVTDMETASVAQVCIANAVPFIAFRSASDLAGGSGSATAEDELEQFFTVAADNSSKVVMRFLSEL